MEQNLNCKRDELEEKLQLLESCQEQLVDANAKIALLTSAPENNGGYRTSTPFRTRFKFGFLYYFCRPQGQLAVRRGGRSKAGHETASGGPEEKLSGHEEDLLGQPVRDQAAQA